MKPGIHPTWYPDAVVTCACGNTWKTGSTKKEIHTDVCHKCHPFFTGEQRIVDTAGQVERFMKRINAKEQLAAAQPAPEDKKAKKEKRRDRKAGTTVMLTPEVQAPAELPLAVVAEKSVEATPAPVVEEPVVPVAVAPEPAFQAVIESAPAEPVAVEAAPVAQVEEPAPVVELAQIEAKVEEPAPVAVEEPAPVATIEEPIAVVAEEPQPIKFEEPMPVEEPAPATLVAPVAVQADDLKMVEGKLDELKKSQDELVGERRVEAEPGDKKVAKKPAAKKAAEKKPATKATVKKAAPAKKASPAKKTAK